MVECTLCSIVGLGFRCLSNMLITALEYPLVVFVLSVLIACLLMTNIHSAKILCDIGNVAARTCGITSAEVDGTILRHFDYGIERGPHTWQCSHTNQSPINIIESNVRQFPIRELLTWNHYDDLPSAIIMENNGHTVVIRATFSGNTPTLSGADLLASYSFVELCFHWSLSNNKGSEHMLNYRHYPMEMQVMHRTGPPAENISSYDLLMVAYFFDISSNNPYLEPIVQNLHRIKMPGSHIEIPPFPLSYLCQYQFRSGFYSYGGSLTQPPCYQGVEWFVFPEPLAIGERQLNEFRQLLSVDAKSRIVQNSRPVQNVHESSRVINLNQYNPVDPACSLMEGQQSQTADMIMERIFKKKKKKKKEQEKRE
ncbi:putative carbonic anhydrase 3, partial [Musca vetustissima]|uniref:putative carbonic anhydrase 3 n=1 Tax=Musca vetustissima TaxID=27455 RepID=UPI002AB7B17C